ncbi:hypothetical protein KUG88_28445, partial [Rhodococcus rhodochrous]|uniref:hypothetical protein n=1 Tax=Rhodococcus rhodochrous TaxID=1829 RepID=UPI001E307DE2
MTQILLEQVPPESGTVTLRSSAPEVDNLEHVSFGEFLEAGQRSGELEKGSKVLTVTFVAH